MIFRNVLFTLVFYGLPVSADNMAVTTGEYASSMGAGAATAMEYVAFGQNPAAFSAKNFNSTTSQKTEKNFGLRLDFNRPFGLEEMSVSDLGAYCDLNHIGLGWGYRQTAVEDVYRETGYQINPRFNFGANKPSLLGSIQLGMQITYWRQEMVAEKTIWKINQGFGGVWRPLPQLALGGFVQGLPLWNGNTKPMEAGNFTDELIWQWGLTVKNTSEKQPPKNIFDQELHIDFRKMGELPLRVSGAYSLGLNPWVKWSLGVCTPTFQIATGVKIGWGGLALNQALRYHRYLGRTSLSGLAYSSSSSGY